MRTLVLLALLLGRPGDAVQEGPPPGRHGVVTGVLAQAPTPAPESAAARQPDSVTVRLLADSLFNAALAGKRFTAAALVVVSGDRIIVRRGYGFADAGRQRAVDPDSTAFNAASVSKVFAAMALMQLADAGRLDLRAPLAPLLGRIRIRGPAAGNVTAEHLLTHTAGLDAKFLGALGPASDVQPRLEDYFVESPPRVVREPGAAIAYSNIGAALEGYVVEAVTGQPFFEYAERAIFTPSGMTMSSFRQPLPAELSSRRAASDRRRAPTYRPYPAASLVTTPADMGRFLIALLNGGRIRDRTLLSERALAEMFAPHWRAHPAVPGVALGFFESVGSAGRALFHTGDGGHHSLLYFIPERHYGVYAVYDTDDEMASALREEVVKVLVTRALVPAAPPEPTPQPPGDFAARAREYVGTFRSNSYSHFNLEKIGSLGSQLSIQSDGNGGLLARQFGGGGSARLAEIAPDAFRTSDGGFAAFRRGGKGRVTSIVFSGSIWDPSTAERAAWYQRAQVQLSALFLVGLVFVARLVTGGARRVRRRRGRAVPTSTTSWRLSGVLSLFVLAAPLVAPLGLFTSRPPFFLPPWSIYVCLLMLLTACILGVVLLAVEWRERRSPAPTWPERVLLRAVAIASVVLAACLWNWNLLGIRV